MIELNIQFGKGYNKLVHTMYFDDYDSMKVFIKKLDGVSSQRFTYEWMELDEQVEINFKCNVCSLTFKDIETFGEHKLSEHTVYPQ